MTRKEDSGPIAPSTNSESALMKLAQAARLLDTELFDHVVIGMDRAVNMKSSGLVPA